MKVEQKRYWNLNIDLKTLFYFLFNLSVYPQISSTKNGPLPELERMMMMMFKWQKELGFQALYQKLFLILWLKTMMMMMMMMMITLTNSEMKNKSKQWKRKKDSKGDNKEKEDKEKSWWIISDIFIYMMITEGLVWMKCIHHKFLWLCISVRLFKFHSI